MYDHQPLKSGSLFLNTEVECVKSRSESDWVFIELIGIGQEEAWIFNLRLNIAINQYFILLFAFFFFFFLYLVM